jgi:hemolysin activation/secretion protein
MERRPHARLAHFSGRPSLEKDYSARDLMECLITAARATGRRLLRRRSALPPHGGARRAMMFFALGVFAMSAQSEAQTRPDAGRILQESQPVPAQPASKPDAALPQQDQRPAMKAPDSQRVLVRHWRISGARVFPTDRLERLLDEYRGQKLTLDELNWAAGRITALYRQHGYLLSRAYIPAQKIREDTVEIAVIEGRVSDMEVINKSRVAGSLITRYLGRLRSTKPVEGPTLERSLLLLGDLPGVEVHSTLRPGASVGTSQLEVQVDRTARLSGAVDADSFGNRYTGQFRGGGTLNVSEPLGYGDSFTLRGDTAGPGMNFGRAGWQLPIGGSGVKAGLAASYLDYRLGKDFQSLQAHGTAQVEGAWTSYSLIRSQYRNLTVNLAYDRKLLDDHIDSTSSSSKRTLDVLTLGLSGDRTDGFGGGGVSVFNVNLVSGRLGLDAAAALTDQSALGHHTQGTYFKIESTYSRTQRLSADTNLYTAVSGQTSNKNLDSSETSSLGGPYGVRAYPENESIGDDVGILNLEVRWKLPDIPELQLVGFFDAGTVRVNHSPLPTDTGNRRTLAGEGMGLQCIRAKLFSFRAYLAWRAGPQPISDVDRRPRALFQFAMYF